MNLERFESQRGPDWVRLEALLRRASGSGRRGRRRLGAEGVLELGSLYRGAAADLAYARRRFPGDPVVARLESLVTRGRAAVYGRVGRRGSVREFFARGYWRRLAERPGIVALAWALLLVPAAAGAIWGLADPGAAVGLVPSEFADAADPPAEGRDFGTGEGSVFATQVLVNNIQVTLMAFVGGLAFGLGTVAAMVFNGLLLGVIGGLAFGAGNGEAFVRLISSHGPLELSCIVVGGVAGLRLGLSLIAPGSRTRLRSLQVEARRAVELAVGTAPWLVVCGFAEGLLTGPELAVGVQVTIGLGLAALFWGLVVWRGRARSSAVVAGDAGERQRQH
ncbi:MAG TPA: stage II sporulation protein M [Solirubrobacteraceae bacterium]|nr:stage II sporulation protein M [Solirubrobacteraceae bacterium]